MASSINASTSGGGGIITTADATGNLNIQSGGSTVVAVTSTGVAVTGTMAVSGTSAFTGAVTLTGGLNAALPVLSGGTGVTTSTGTGAGVHSVGPSISSAVMTTMASSVITSGTTVASTSGTSIDFTGIPSWVKRITVMLSGVSTNGSSAKLIQIGAGSITSTGYIAASIQFTANASVGSTAGFPIYGNSTADTVCGSLVLTTLGSNIWVASGNAAPVNAQLAITAGGVTLGGTLDRVRFTTVNGTDAFDAGSVNILYD
jgi:hypothetical protein